ncbi:hypothetical protein SAMN06272775_0679 [Streptomyces sp. 2323.1]|nr:hypothetical protein SAMN06272775_0679 [Streptomyces sp. 2323.1]
MDIRKVDARKAGGAAAAEPAGGPAAAEGAPQDGEDGSAGEPVGAAVRAAHGKGGEPRVVNGSADASRPEG